MARFSPVERGSPPGRGMLCSWNTFLPFCSMSCCYANNGALTLVGEGGGVPTFTTGPGCNGGFKGAGTAQETSGGIKTVEQLC